MLFRSPPHRTKLRGNDGDVDDDLWHGVSHLAFDLTTEASVLFTYALPVTQHGNPHLGIDSWTYERWATLQTRMLVDGTPFRHGAAAVDGNVDKLDTARGTLVVELAAGSHTAVLQWRTPDSARRGETGTDPSDHSSWTTLSSMYDGYVGADELIAVVNSEPQRPVIVLGPETAADEGRVYEGAYACDEDSSLVVSGVSIHDAYAEGSASVYLLRFVVAVTHGDVSLVAPGGGNAFAGLTMAVGNARRAAAGGIPRPEPYGSPATLWLAGGL